MRPIRWIAPAGLTRKTLPSAVPVQTWPSSSTTTSSAPIAGTSRRRSGTWERVFVALGVTGTPR